MICTLSFSLNSKNVVVERVPPLRAFWDLEKPVLHETPSIMNRAVCSYRFVPCGTLEVPRGVCQMNGAPQSGAEQCTTVYESLRV